MKKANKSSNSDQERFSILLSELLRLEDVRFIYESYRFLLGRVPDPEGMLYYLKRLRSGVRKMEILAQLYFSVERRRCIGKVPVIGLDRALWAYKYRKSSLWRNIFKISRIFRGISRPAPIVYPVESSRGLSHIFSKMESEESILCNYTLSPINQIEFISPGGEWNSLGLDPSFEMDFVDSPMLEPGWYIIALSLVSQHNRGIAKLYLDTGAGYNEKDTISLPYRSGELIQRVFFLKTPILSVRFDPCESQGEFKIEVFDLERISERQAIFLMLERLHSCDKQYEKMSLEGVSIVLEALAKLGNLPADEYILNEYSNTFICSQGGIDYKDWIELVEKVAEPTCEVIKATITNISTQPLISVVMPVYNTQENFLYACIESVLAQSYPKWELCIADDASTKEHVRRVLEEYQRKDERIKVVYREVNGNISRASNSALEIANGDFVALLDHDDVIPRNALYFFAEAINNNPHALIFYSDEDKIDERGNRFEPHFKSDWNPDLFFSQNYVSHLGVYRRALLQKIGGFRTGVEGSQDQDLLLRCLPYVEAEQIVHVPRVLYHWRTVEGSTALAAGEKSYTTEAGLKALRDYFEAFHPSPVQVEAGLLPNTYRVRWPLPSPAPRVSLLIPTRDRKRITEVAVRSILEKTTYPNYEIVILDNGSVEPETLAFFETIQREDDRVRVLRYDHPFNYSAINNFGVAHTEGEIIGLINNDIEIISPEWLSEMVSHACRPEIGCVGAKLYYGNDTVQHGGVVLGIGGIGGHSHKYVPRYKPGYFSRLMLIQSLSAVTAACLIVRREVFNAVGGLDEENLKVAFNDVDFCLKVREAGYRNLWTPYAELYHHESISRGHEDTPEKQKRFGEEVDFMKNKWGEELRCDPYYNPNLTKEKEDFSIGFVRL